MTYVFPVTLAQYQIHFWNVVANLWSTIALKRVLKWNFFLASIFKST